MNRYLIKNATIVNEGVKFISHVLIVNKRIAEIVPANEYCKITPTTKIIDAKGKWLFPGIIDDQVHFRDPGLTHKGDLYSEAKAAIAGGTTSYLEMPNTIPQTTTKALVKEKLKMAATKSLANFGFYIGATNDNIQELKDVNRKLVCGIKVFMGASTGNMLVDDPQALNEIFGIQDLVIAVHCEDEPIIKKNLAEYFLKFGDDIPVEYHPKIRSHEACRRSSALAMNLARKNNTRLHIIHLSTQDEVKLFSSDIPLGQKRITSEACIHHLWFDESDYQRKGTLIKWNPAIKSLEDKEALIAAVKEDRIDIVATDHAPHTLEEKDQVYTKAPSGGPMVQHSLLAMLEFEIRGLVPIEKTIEKMCHNPAILFDIKERGFIRKGYYADLVIVDPEDPWTVTKHNILYKCGWSPLEGTSFRSRITHTFVNGNLVFDNGIFDESKMGVALEYDR